MSQVSCLAARCLLSKGDHTRRISSFPCCSILLLIKLPSFISCMYVCMCSSTCLYLYVCISSSSPHVNSSEGMCLLVEAFLLFAFTPLLTDFLQHSFFPSIPLSFTPLLHHHPFPWFFFICIFIHLSIYFFFLFLFVPTYTPSFPSTLSSFPPFHPSSLSASPSLIHSFHPSHSPVLLNSHHFTSLHFLPSFHHSAIPLAPIFLISHPPPSPQDPDDLQEKTVSTVSTRLLGLDPYTNYSITTAAYTRRGDGVRSPAIYCITDEDGKTLRGGRVRGRDGGKEKWLEGREGGESRNAF